MEILIFITVIVITFLLGRYAISEGQRIEQQKKFMKNMEEYDKPKYRHWEYATTDCPCMGSGGLTREHRHTKDCKWFNKR